MECISDYAGSLSLSMQNEVKYSMTGNISHASESSACIHTESKQCQTCSYSLYVVCGFDSDQVNRSYRYGYCSLVWEECMWYIFLPMVSSLISRALFMLSRCF